MNCRHCKEEFTATADKPGFIDECADCAVDIPRVKAGQSEGLDGCVSGLLFRGKYPNGLWALANFEWERFAR